MYKKFNKSCLFFNKSCHNAFFAFLFGNNNVKYNCEKMPFMEAVEHLANLAGLKIPDQNPKNQAQETKFNTLLDIMERACLFYPAFGDILIFSKGSFACCVDCVDGVCVHWIAFLFQYHL